MTRALWGLLWDWPRYVAAREARAAQYQVTLARLQTPEEVPGVFTTAMQGPGGFHLKPAVEAHLAPFWPRELTHAHVRVVTTIDQAVFQEPTQPVEEDA